ncbi:MAG: hypothetical protein GWO20_03765 [Candidatus Korarchaeota archaeon]|nr:hypothetical protein [Candidatus Korarchaeota archaeon]NIU82531.1 hypothetical protein [Candidatus Thorarchaeota archaeon]NIW13023.1 hypothetical protein [Candidatus Thorarchaeota archaeon]NIW52161.1 hypothetical protein [Candidatus Korarchaeota archaeon]
MSEKEEQKTTKKRERDNVILRNYSKVIFFYPLFFVSLVLAILQMLNVGPVAIYGFVWMIVFAANLFVMAFNFSSTKFLVLLLILIIIALLFTFLVAPNVELGRIPMPQQFNIEMSMQFYFTITLILGFILLLVLISTRLDYWVVEQNEVYHKQGIFAEENRYPTRNLRIKKKIPDVFEFLTLAAGSITLYLGEDEDIHFPTVPKVNAKIERLNVLLSEIEVEIVE